jgi:Zn-dependent M28 family amino/carboxypeptidase
MKSFLLGVLFASAALAHGDMDWNSDYQAFLSFRFDSVIKTEKNNDFRTRYSEIDMDFFKEKLLILTGETPFKGDLITERKSNQKLDLTRAFLKDEYEKLGFTVSLHPFGSGTNIIAEKVGTTSPDKVLILSSHIDSVGNKGANDDGSGTIGLLAVAKKISRRNLPITIRILGFDREEIGLRGSDAYVASITDKQNIIGDIHFEMMGYNGRKDGAFHVIDCNSSLFGRNKPVENSLFLSQEMKNSIAKKNLDLTITKACTDRSDHASFWRHKIPAIVISENFFGGDGDPCYHARCDVVDERLDYDYMGMILTALHDSILQISTR